MRTLFLGFLLTASVNAEWNPQQAASYLDGRQKEWFAWKVAAAPGGVCVSCHTGTTYLLVRPALRRVLGEKDATTFETGLLGALRARAGKRDVKDVFNGFQKEPAASQAMGVESVHAAQFLAANDREKGQWSEATRQAFDRLWSLQIKEGKNKGAWPWFSLNLDPWEMPESVFYGATQAALAIGAAPADYRARPEVKEKIRALVEYFQREASGQPLHNRIALLWASSALPDVMSKADRKKLVSEAWKAQQADGGWTIASLGPWKANTAAPVSSGSNGYATGLATYALLKAGVKPQHTGMRRALEWLQKSQESTDGSWNAESMNKKFEAGSMQIRFMRDAATAFSTLALIEAKAVPGLRSGERQVVAHK